MALKIAYRQATCYTHCRYAHSERRSMKLRSNARTDVGKTRDHNEDTFGIGEGELVERLGELLVVCDGMGGHAAGEVASQLAAAVILEAYYADDREDRPAALRDAFLAANSQVHDQGRGTMGTTGVAAVLHHDALHVANVGDSRAYLIRDNAIRQITRDHSFVSDQIAAGVITPEQARMSAHRNIITRALGHQPQITVDLFRWPLQIGDQVLLCSDGLHSLIDDEDLLQIIDKTPFEDVADSLVDLANERGGTDNITVVVAQVEALDWDAQPVPDEADTSRVTEPITEQLSTTAISKPEITRPQEPRLSLLGGLLATLLLLVLLFATLFVYLNPASHSETSPTVIATAPAAATVPAQTTTPTANPASTATP